MFIARETGRALADLPDDAVIAVSVITVAELRLGVLVASDPVIRAIRLATLEAATRDNSPLPVNGQVADQFARLVWQLRVA
ncbi:PilT protein domain protein, partial [mine drainage metagenome]